MIIPRNEDQFVALARAAVAGATALEGPIGVKQNTAAAIAADLDAYLGRPAHAGPPAVLAVAGRIQEMGDAKAALALAQSSAQQKKAAAIKCGADTIDALKRQFGRQWNSRWQAAGFAAGSIAISKGNPAFRLDKLAAYLRAHPAAEIPAAGVTAAQIETAKTEHEAARQAVLVARVAQRSAVLARDRARTTLRTRLTALQDELHLLLADDDLRWYQFGFSRPADGRVPAPVAGLTARAMGAGQLYVEWQPSAAARNYRVVWRQNQPASPSAFVGFYSDPNALINGIPTGMSVLIGVSARNAFGETPVKEFPIVAP